MPGDDVGQRLHNLITERRSHVTASSNIAREPHLAHQTILAHESVWLDSRKIPVTITGDMTPLFTQINDIVLANAMHAGALFDSDGNVVPTSIRDGGTGIVQKLYRMRVARGTYGEYSSAVLRHAVHENISMDSAQSYRPLVEFSSSGGAFRAIDDADVDVDYNSGVIRIRTPDDVDWAYVSLYKYVGRIGLDELTLYPTTDNIPEGAVNKYVNREVITAWISDDLNELAPDGMTVNADILRDGERNVFYTKDRFERDLAMVTTDDVIEGVANTYFTSDRFDAAFASRTLADVTETPDVRAVTEKSMRSLGHMIGDVPEIKFRPLPSAPVDRTSKLYVERIGGEDVLHFGSEAVATGATTSGVASGAPASFGVTSGGDASLGEFHGAFTGESSGVHTGDVLGNVTGFVSSLGNHPIIESTVLGGGEGHWVGTVNGDVFGKFEGYAKIVTGSLDNVYHITVGTYDTNDSLVHIRGTSNHIRLSHVDGAGAAIACDADGSVSIVAPVLTTSQVHADAVRVRGSAHVETLYAGHANTVGITNSHYGMYEVGVLHDVTDIVASGTISTSLGVVARHVSAASLTCGAMAAISFLSVHTLHVGNMNLSIGGGDGGSGTNLGGDSVVSSLSSSTVSTTALRAATGRFGTISVAGNAYLGGAVLAPGESVVGSLNVGAGAVTTDLRVRSDAVVEGTLSTGGVVTFGNHVNFDSGASVSGTVHATNIDATGSVATSHIGAITARIGTHLSASTIGAKDIIASSSLTTSSLSVSTSMIGTARAIQLDVDTQLRVAGTVCASMLSASAIHADSVVAPTLHTHAARVGSLSIAADMHVEGAMSVGGAVHLADAIHATPTRVVIASPAITLDGPVSTHGGEAAVFHVRGGGGIDVSPGPARFGGDVIAISDVSIGGTLTFRDGSASTLSVAHIVGPAIVSAVSTAVTNAVTTPSFVSGLIDPLWPSVSALVASSISIAVPWEVRSQVRSAVDAAIIASLPPAVHSNVPVIVAALLPGSVRESLSQTDLVSSAVQTHLPVTLAHALPSALDHALSTLSLSATAGDHLSLVTLSVSSILTSQLASVGSLCVQSLSVGSAPGLVTDVIALLSASGALGHIVSAGGIISYEWAEADVLSVGTLIADNIHRTYPHISDNAVPSFITGKKGTDFAFFDTDADAVGDLIVRGNLYVTDTIFVGTERALTIRNVREMQANFISVGSLHVDRLLDSSSLGNINEFLGPAETVHEGNFAVRGNLMISGLMVTGAFNEIAASDGETLVISNATSVTSRDISAGSIVVGDDTGNADEGSTAAATFYGVASLDTVVLRSPRTPSTSSDSAQLGTWTWDQQYLYIAISTDRWRRVALSDF